MKDLAGYRVIVTGASQGIGRGIALAFARAGSAVSICARGEAKLARTHAELEAVGGKVHSQICDLADGEAVCTYVEAAAQALGGIDVLVNNVTGFGRADTEEGWSTAFAVDVMATMRANWTALPYIRQSAYGSFIHITSTTAFKASVKAPAYAAVKAALVHYTKCQAKTLAKEGIRVNSVAPGSTTDEDHFFEQRRLAGDPSYDAVLATMPTGRLGAPDDVADVVTFLASRAARWVTGQTIIADGGQYLFDNT